MGASVVASDITMHREANDGIVGSVDYSAQAQNCVLGKTTDGTIVSWNKGAEKIYGHKADEILGQPVSVLIPPGHGGELGEIMTRLQRGST